MISKLQNHHNATPRPSFSIIPPPCDIQNMPNLTPPSEFPQSPQSQFKLTNKKQVHFVAGCSSNQMCVYTHGESP